MGSLNRIFYPLHYQSLTQGESGEDRIHPCVVNGLGIDMKTQQSRSAGRVSEREMRQWLSGGLTRPESRLALFDQFGEPIDRALVREAIRLGYAEPWFANPMRPEWMVCRLTARGRAALDRHDATR